MEGGRGGCGGEELEGEEVGRETAIRLGKIINLKIF